jgi:hypothetical protein
MHCKPLQGLANDPRRPAYLEVAFGMHITSAIGFSHQLNLLFLSRSLFSLAAELNI